MDVNDTREAIRIQFDISHEDYRRMERYIFRYQDRNIWAREALIERVKRMEARDERATAERAAKDRAMLIEVVTNVVLDEVRKAMEDYK